MEFSTIELILGLISFLGIYWYVTSRRPRNYPPGPPRLPIIGNLHQLSDEPAKDFMKMRAKYGDIIGVDLGSFPAVVINDYKLIKEALAENTFTGRAKFDAFKERALGKPGGVIFLDGQDWVDQRRFILKNLRDFGIGKKSMEGLVHDEIQELIEGFKESAGTPISMQNKFNAAVLNALWSIVTGERYAHTDPKLGDLIKRLTSGIQQARSLSASLFFPKLRKVLPLMFGGMSLKDRRANHKKTVSFMTDSIQAHKKTYQEDMARDFIDVYLSEINKTTDHSSSFYDKEGIRNLTVVMLDLFFAGAETTSSTLSWAFLLLALHQESQAKLFQEIKKIAGQSRLPSLSDRPEMPYTEAVIMEVMRYSAMVPLALMHRTTEDVNFHGHFIPADTLILPNLYCAMKDEKVWGDPDNFRPERFLSEDGTKVIRHEAFMPFSTGKRVCLGETLARDELFLFMTSLFQRFLVGPDPKSPIPKIEYYTAAILLPKAHTLVLKDRLEEH